MEEIWTDLLHSLDLKNEDCMDAVKHSNRVIFVDTDSLTTLFYANFLLKENRDIERCTKLAEAINEISEWDLCGRK